MTRISRHFREALRKPPAAQVCKEGRAAHLSVFFMGLNLEMYTSMSPCSCSTACSSVKPEPRVAFFVLSLVWRTSSEPAPDLP